MLRYLLDIFKYVGKVGKNTLLNPFIRLRYSVTRKTNVKLIFADFVKKKIKAVQKFLLGKPKKLEDYVEFKRFYVAKSLLIVILVLCIAIPILFYVFAVPFLVQKFGTASLIETSAEVKKYSGKARVLTEERELVYKGELKEGLKQGKGELYNADGYLVYRGTFVNDLKEGEGIEYYPSGSIRLRGMFKAGNPEGFCIEYYENGTVKYEGEFLFGQYNGKGILYNKERMQQNDAPVQGGEAAGGGAAQDKRNGKVYEGEFKNGRFCGNGILYDNDGNMVFEGAFLDGYYHGKGRLYENGTLVYDGDFVKGEFFGTGKLYDAKTGILVYEGEFKGGEYSGKGVLYSKAGRVIYDGPFMNGDINYRYLLGLPADDIRSILSEKYDTVMLDDGFCLVSSDLGLSVFLNYADIDVESSSQELIVNGEKKVFGIAPGQNAEEISKALGEPLAFTETMVRDRDAVITELPEWSSIYKAVYLIDEYRVEFCFEKKDGKWIYAVIGSR